MAVGMERKSTSCSSDQDFLHLGIELSKDKKIFRGKEVCNEHVLVFFPLVIGS